MRTPAVNLTSLRLFASLKLKIFGVIVAVTVSLVGFFVTYFPAVQVASARRAVEHKAEAYAQLIARQVEAAIAFNDVQSARDVFAAAMDADVRALALYAEDGEVLAVMGALSGPLGAQRASEGPELEGRPGVIRCVAPVVSRQGPRGVLVIELSTRSFEDERDRSRRAAVLVGLVSLGVGLAAAWLIARTIGDRVRRITRATAAISGGDLTVKPLVDAAPDEIGQLARSVNEMVKRLGEKVRLDRLVAERGRELDQRHADMRLVLDHVNDGLVAVDRRGVLADERSAVLERWLGPVPAGATLWAYLAPIDANVSAWFEAAWDAVVDDVLPIEVALDQLPKEIRHQGAVFQLEYTPIFEGAALTRLLLVVSDVTSRVERELAEASERETSAVVERVVHCRSEFLEFFAEADELVAKIMRWPEGGELAELLRAIHTLKGNAGLFGLKQTAALCHELESGAADTCEAPTEAQRAALGEMWARVSSFVGAFVNDPAGRQDRVEVDAQLLERLRSRIARGRPQRELLDLFASLTFEGAERWLERGADHARALAARLDKPGLAVHVEPNGVRFDAPAWAPFWAAFTHVIRNAVDHGIEGPDDRRRAGKPEHGTLTLRTRLVGAEVLVELTDDGRGIDWAAVARSAATAGIPSVTHQDLVEALFRDGMSTREAVTEWSGRGVGLAAVRSACRELGGAIAVRTEPGRGTTFELRMPSRGASGPRVTVTPLSLAPHPIAASG
jgi:signal transduction histidine kinase